MKLENQDIMTPIKELVNLNSIYSKYLEKLTDKFGLSTQTTEMKKFTRLDYVIALPGQREEVPENWIGAVTYKVGQDDWGPGYVIAIKKVGNWYIPGVEFMTKVSNGHSLSLRNYGIIGREGQCLWIPCDDLTVDSSLDN